MRYGLDSYLPLGAFEHCGNGKIRLHGGPGGGGGIPIVSDVYNAVSDAVSSVGDALSQIDPGPAIGQAGQAVDEAVNDAIPGGWAMVGAVALTVLSAGTVDLEPEVLAAEGATEMAGPTYAELGYTGAEAAGPTYAELGYEGANAASTADAINAADAASKAANTALDVTSTLDVANPEIVNPDVAPYAGDAAYEAQGLQEGYESAANPLGSVTNPDGSITQTFDDGSTITTRGGEVIDTTNAISDPLTLQDFKNAYNAYKVGKTAYGLANALTGSTGALKTVSPLTRTVGLPSLLGGAPASTSGGALPGSLEATSLAAAPVTQGSNMNLAQLKQLYPQLSTIDPRLVQTLAGRTTANSPFSALSESNAGTNLSIQGQGGTPSAGYPAIAADKTAGTTKFAGNPLSGSFDALTSAGLHAISGGALPSASKTYGLKDGGQPHVPQFKTGTTGHYVQGAGDGQSDDIPAMLADGEYVFDADTVAALGNGSNKAGALQLDKMRQAIRKHKRAAPHNKIPPKAKSPLEYLKGK